MRKFALLSLLLLTTSLFAFTPALSRWQITPTVSVQYNPTVWELDVIKNSDQQALFLIDRPNIALDVTIIPTTEAMGAADIIASRVAKTEDEKGVTRLALKEYQAGEEYGVLFAYTTQNDKGAPLVVGRWSFTGDKLDTKSRIVLEFEGVVPATAANGDIMQKMEAVIQTYQIK